MPKEEIANLALRRSLFYPSAEIYPNAPSGFWNFGPDGETIRRKIVEFWRNELVEKEGFFEVNGCQILPEPVFQASGHLDNFNDPLVQCGKCHALHRADELIEQQTGEKVPEAMESGKMDRLLEKHGIRCPKCKGKLEKVKKFNMMMKVDIGAVGNQPAYLRPETCQSIFLDFPRIYKTMRRNLPIGMAQAGKSFRNEIAPRNTLLREREIGQMEIEVFFDPDKINEQERFGEVADYKLNLLLLKNKGKVTPVRCADAVKKKLVSGKLVAYYLARVQQMYEKLGIATGKMRFRELEAEARAHYARETWDFEVETDLGWVELIANNYRVDFDLKGHAKLSKQDLAVKEDGKKFIPHVFEISAGIDRTLYVVLDHAFRKEQRGPEERIYLDLKPEIAPYLATVFPLVKKDGLAEKGREVFNLLNEYHLDIFYDEKGSIGKRYARADEIGIPYAITVDHDTLQDGTVTLRERNSMVQKRVKAGDLPLLLWEMKSGKMPFKELK